VKVNDFVNTTCAKSGGLKVEDFKIKEDDNDVAIDSFYFTGNASGQMLDMVIVFDDTGSMGNEIDALKLKVANLTHKINSSKLDARYSLITVKQDIVATKTNWTNDESFINTIGKLSASGGDEGPENSLGGIERALSWGFRPDSQKVIIVVTDELSHQKGDESNSSYKMEYARSDLLNSGAILIAISPDFRNQNVDSNVPRSDLLKYADMRELASEVSGLWIDIKTADFSTILEQLQGRLTGTYVIEYASPDLTPDTNRTVTVEVNNPSCDEAVGSTNMTYKSPMKT
jgi:hypothetical protein